MSADDRPRLLGIFPSQFPGWGRDGHEHNGKPCDMGAHRNGICYSRRFLPTGVSAIDVNGHLWVLVRDIAVPDAANENRWVRFPVEFVR